MAFCIYFVNEVYDKLLMNQIIKAIQYRFSMGAHIVFIEDDENINSMFTEFLSSEGYNVTPFSDGLNIDEKCISELVKNSFREFFTISDAATKFFSYWFVISLIKS